MAFPIHAFYSFSLGGHFGGVDVGLIRRTRRLFIPPELVSGLQRAQASQALLSPTAHFSIPPLVSLDRSPILLCYYSHQPTPIQPALSRLPQ